MNSEARNEFDAKYEERVRKIREAASAAIKELDQLPSAGSMARTAFDAEVAPIAQEKLHPHGCDLVVHPVGDGIPRFVIGVQGGEIRIQSRFEFLPTLQLVNPKRRRPNL